MLIEPKAERIWAFADMDCGVPENGEWIADEGYGIEYVHVDLYKAARAEGRVEGLREAAEKVEVLLTRAMTSESPVGRMLHALDGALIRQVRDEILALLPKTGEARDLYQERETYERMLGRFSEAEREYSKGKFSPNSKTGGEDDGE